jgi:HEAT repeat protein
MIATTQRQMHSARHWRSCRVVGLLVCAALMGVATGILAEEPNDELVQMVVNLLGDQDKDLRAVGLEQVRTELKSPAATLKFVALLPKLPPEAQAALLVALADRGDKAARPGVLAMLADSKDEAVRIAAVRALGSLGEVDDIDRLVGILAKGIDAEQAAAIKSITRLQGEGVQARIASLVGKNDSRVGVALIEILSTRRALDTVATLVEAAGGNDPVVRGAAMKALADMADTSSLPGMIAAVLKAEPGKERDAAERSVAAVCAKAGDPDQRAEVLLAEVNKRPSAEQLALLPLVGRVGGAPALKVIEAAIADGDATRHEMGIRALCHWPYAVIAPRLFELIKADEHPEHRAMALAAVVRVAPYRDERTDTERMALLEKALSLSQTDKQREAVIKRAGTIRTVEALRFLLPYTDDPKFAETACLGIVELAHHRGLREPNKPEFDKALDKVMATSKDAVVVDRAKRYKAGQTWVKGK